MPWALTDETEQQHLLEAMDALLEISRRLSTEDPLALGLIEGDPFTHPIPLLTATPDGYRWDSYTLQKPDAPALPAGKIEDELALARLKKRKKPCAPWALAVFMSPTPVQAKPAQVPYFPYLLCVVDTGSGKVLTLTPPRKIDDGGGHLFAGLAVGAGIAGAGAAAVYGSAVGVGTAAAYGSATGAGVPFGAYCAVAVGGMPGAGA